MDHMRHESRRAVARAAATHDGSVPVLPASPINERGSSSATRMALGSRIRLAQILQVQASHSTARALPHINAGSDLRANTQLDPSLSRSGTCRTAAALKRSQTRAVSREARRSQASSSTRRSAKARRPSPTPTADAGSLPKTGWQHWEVPFDTDPDWPKPLQEPSQPTERPGARRWTRSTRASPRTPSRRNSSTSQRSSAASSA